MNNIDLCMIVKNEEKYLRECLTNIKDLVENIIIVDTGSTDNTIRIAEEFNAKIYNYNWINDFSSARNFSLSKATSKWILILDADEILDLKSKDKLINFINNTNKDGCHFLVKNYINETLDDYTLHYAFRLVKNYRGYKFKGRIHEQISNDNINIKNRFVKEDIILHHYGYLSSVTIEKDKRGRNIPIILESLKDNPRDSFQLFNLGNEYLSENNLEKALEYYQKSYEYSDKTMLYSPHLLYRMSLSYKSLKLYELALKYVNEALSLYNPNVDFLYLQGLIYKDLKKPTMAMRSFEECIIIGDSKSSIKFSEDCGSTKPLLALADLYYDFEDYNMALIKYTEVINKNPQKLYLLYKIGSCLNKLYEDKTIVAKNLLKYFSDSKLYTNRILLADILIEEELFNESKKIINETNYPENSKDHYYLEAILDFYNGNYRTSLDKFLRLIDIEVSSTNIINNIESKSYEYIFLISLIISDMEFYPLILEKENNKIKIEIYKSLYEIYYKKPTKEIKSDTNIYLLFIENLLYKLLIIKEYDLFEKLIGILNYIDNNTILISLAKVYDKANLKDLSVKYVLKSIKELNLINYEGINILYKEIR